MYGESDVSAPQKSLELIHARNLLSSVATPAFLVDAGGDIVFFNEAAGGVLGRRFEETGPIGHDTWRKMVGPFDDQGEPIPFEQLTLNIALRHGEAGHLRQRIREADGGMRQVEVSAVPLLATTGGFRGAIVFLWPVEVANSESVAAPADAQGASR